MRRFPKSTLCLSVFLGCICTWILVSHAAKGLPPAPAKAVAGPSGEASEQADKSKQFIFPYAEFEAMFNRLAEEMGVGNTSETEFLPDALEKLFNSIPEPVAQKGKSIPHTRHGLLKKMLASKMERESGSKRFDASTFTKEFQNALKMLGEFHADSTASPTGALQKLSQLTKRLFAPEGANNMQQYMGRTAEILKDLLPLLHGSDDEL